MNENEAAEQFNRNLDAALSGARRVASGPDPEAMETAAKFIRADFSGESAIKDELRARFAADPRVLETSPDEPKLFRLNFYAKASLAAACLVMIVAVLMRPGERRAAKPGSAQPAIEAVIPGGPAGAVQTADARSGAIRAAGEPISAARPVQEFFDSIPMARLAGERLENHPIETKAAGAPIAVVQGRKVALADGTSVVWETEDAVFTLESREIKPEDIFQRTAL